jgi:Tfp pilus assembly protein PilO
MVEKMTLSKSILCFVALAIALPAGAYFGVIRPTEKRRLDLQTDIAAKRENVATLHQSMGCVLDCTTKVETLRTAVAEFEARLPADGQMDKVLEDIWHLAQANSLQTRTVKTPAMQRTAGYSEQTMELSLAGDFAGFYQFLLQLEDSKRAMRIKKMHLSRLGGRDGEMQADVTLSVYFEPKPDSL